MNVAKALIELRAELDNLESAIAILERLQEGSRRGESWLPKPAKVPVRNTRKAEGSATGAFTENS